MTINSMKNKKAADMVGLTAEHLKYGGNVLVRCITELVNRIINSGDIPHIFR